MKYIIIGAGISGLYTAYNIKKKYPDADILILEKDRIGGRMGLKSFYGAKVPIGAGSGRSCDILLRKLVKNMKMKAKKVKIKNYFTFNPINIKKIINFLKLKLKNLKLRFKNFTFKKFFLKYIPDKKIYKLFVESCGFSDYENEDIKRTLYNYHMEDNEWTGYKYVIDWNLLLDRLVKFSNPKIVIDCVKSFKLINNKIHVKGDIDNYICDKLIIATCADTLHKLIPGYEYIKGQSFLRVYAKFFYSKLLINKMNELNNPNCIITNNILQKIIPINIKKGIYMIAYADNKKADKLNLYTKNKKYFESLFNKTIFAKKNNSSKKNNLPKKTKINSLTKKTKKNNLPKIKEIWAKYWKIGTHYFSPHIYNNKNKQMPYKNVFIVGEMISNHQGWTEGALESVENIKKKL